jgi:spoIIIJ-associated protein
VEDVEASGKSVEEAVEKALGELGVSRSQVEVEVLREGRGGILGFGGEEARVRVRPLVALSTEGDTQMALEVLRQMLEFMKVDAEVSVRAPETPGDGVGLVKAVLDVRGEDLGILIGRRGDTLANVQYIVNLIVSRRTKARAAFAVDVEGYRRRREEGLERLGLRMAERVRRTGQTVTLEPMPPNERRIVHLALAEDSSVVTSSIGEGEARKVSIAPRR